MALTAVSCVESALAPRDLTYLALGTGNTQGFTITLASGATVARGIAIQGDVDWYWSYQDSQTAATTAMVRVRADAREQFQVTPAGVTIYAKTASGTSNLVVIQVY